MNKVYLLSKLDEIQDKIFDIDNIKISQISNKKIEICVDIVRLIKEIKNGSEIKK